MEIVKFKSGRYGVRKWTFDLLTYGEIGWVYALNRSGSWAPKSDRWVQEFDTKEFAVEVLTDMQDRYNITNDGGRKLNK